MGIAIFTYHSGHLKSLGALERAIASTTKEAHASLPGRREVEDGDCRMLHLTPRKRCELFGGYDINSSLKSGVWPICDREKERGWINYCLIKLMVQPSDYLPLSISAPYFGRDCGPGFQ